MSFKFPNELEVVRAMEIAELLLNNVKAKELHSCCIDISDIKRKGEKGDSYITGIHFEDDYKTQAFQLTGWLEGGRRVDYHFDTTEIQFYYLLRSMFVVEHDRDKLINTILMLLESLKIKTPSEFVKVVEVHR